MNPARKEEAIYVALAFFTAIGQLTWVQMTYNDPSVASAWTAKQWLIVGGISAVFVITATLIAWKAYLHDPRKYDLPPRLTIPPPPSPAPPPSVPDSPTPDKPANIGTV